MFNAVTGSVEAVLWVVFLIVKGLAFVDCLRWRADAYPAIGRQSKVFWAVLLGAAFVLGFFFPALGIIGLAGIAAALVYLLDVRARLKEVLGR
jgi:hypothetical protein